MEAATLIPPKDRPSARELAAQGEKPLQIAGQPADKCPYCGCAMFADGTRKHDTVTFRYVTCRNRSCNKRFLSKQLNARIVREIERGEDGPSNIGQDVLMLYSETG